MNKNLVEVGEKVPLDKKSVFVFLAIVLGGLFLMYLESHVDYNEGYGVWSSGTEISEPYTLNNDTMVYRSTLVDVNGDGIANYPIRRIPKSVADAIERNGERLIFGVNPNAWEWKGGGCDYIGHEKIKVDLSRILP